MRAWSAALDLVFPRRCEMCGRKLRDPADDLLCPTCAPHAGWTADPACPRCGAGLSAEGAACRECARRTFSFRGAVAAGPYGGFIRDLVHRLKYDGRTDLARPLGARLAARIRAARWGGELDVVVPVPMRRWKILAGRRYNAAALLAERIGRELDLPVRAALRAARAVPSQTSLTGEQRRGNPSGAYAARSPRALRDRRVLLVDDVLTTGATASECARVLKGAGAAQVRLAVVGR